jgi:hypothetical protein
MHRTRLIALIALAPAFAGNVRAQCEPRFAPGFDQFGVPGRFETIATFQGDLVSSTIDELAISATILRWNGTTTTTCGGASVNQFATDTTIYDMPECDLSGRDSSRQVPEHRRCVESGDGERRNLRRSSWSLAAADWATWTSS